MLAKTWWQPESIITLLLALLLITPLCGWLFQCGCTWPWAGLATHCNYYVDPVGEHCPWCQSLLAGSLSVGLVVASAYFTAVSTRYTGLFRAFQVNEIFIRVACALLVLLFVATFTAWISAAVLGYSDFVLGN